VALEQLLALQQEGLGKYVRSISAYIKMTDLVFKTIKHF
jgi:hypothetical protein